MHPRMKHIVHIQLLCHYRVYNIQNPACILTSNLTFTRFRGDNLARKKSIHVIIIIKDAPIGQYKSYDLTPHI